MRPSFHRSRRHRSPLYSEGELQQPFFSVKSAETAQTEAINPPFFQSKLSVGQPGDKYEKEADAMANRITEGKNGSQKIQPKEISVIQRKDLKGNKEEEPLQRKDKEEEEPVQKQEEEEEPVQAKKDEKEEEKPVQKQEETEEDVQAKKEEKEEEKPVQKQEEEEEPVQAMKGGEEEDVQTKTGTGETGGGQKLGSQISKSAGRGFPLPGKVRTSMESAFRTDFSGVNIHTDTEAVSMNKKLGAQAFTRGKDIYFNSGRYKPDNPDGKKLIAHELTHVIQQGAGGNLKAGSFKRRLSNQVNTGIVMRQGLLNDADEKAAIIHNKKLLDNRTVMILQIITGTNVDGKVGSLTVEAVAAYQSANGLAINGKIDDATLLSLFNNRVVAGRYEHAIQFITDYYNIDLTNVLSVHFDPGIFFSNVSFQPGGVRVITVGPLSFLSPLVLKFFIERELSKPVPPVPALGPRPDHLTAAQEVAAIRYNISKYKDQRAVHSIQGLVGATPDGKFGGDTVERIAEFQSTNGIALDGKVGEQTLRILVPKLHLANQQDTAIRLIMDFYNMKEFGALIDIYYDPTLAGPIAVTPSKDIPGPDIVKIGPKAFNQGYEGLVHTIAHELEHVRQNKLGIADIPLSEFLGEAIEIISKGMPAENIAGFFDDASRAIKNWQLMQVADQRNYWNRFLKVREVVRKRFAAASAAEKIANQPTMNTYNAQAKP